jgi:hypothetical protein
MKHRFTALILMVTAVLLAACATLLGSQNLEIPLSKIQESIANRVPIDKRVVQLLDIRITNPQVALQPGTNRLLTSMDTSISPPLTSKSFAGSIAISGQLEIDPARQAVVLADPRVERFTVNGLDPLYANQLTRIGNLLAEQLLENVALYTFKPEQLHYAGVPFQPARITTGPNSIVVTFEPVK